MKPSASVLTLLLSLLLWPVSAALAQDVKPGNVQAGHDRAAMCMGCHSISGYQASFPEVHKVPMISGQNAKYLAAALSAYKKGDRKHPTMRAIAASLTEQDIADLSAFYEQDGGKTEVGAVPAATGTAAALLQKGGCVACHGETLSKPIDPSYPKLGGQHGDYLFAALKAYKVERNPNIGRANPIMVAQVKQFSNAELKTLANYLAAIPGELKTVPQKRFR